MQVNLIGQSKENEDLERNQTLEVLLSNCGIELDLIATLAGRRNVLDRVECAGFMKAENLLEHEGIEITPELRELLDICSAQQLAGLLPKYELPTETRESMLMHWIQEKLCHPDILKVLWEKNDDTSLPFDALKDLCERLQQPLSEEQCIFICTNYYVRIVQAEIFINFKEFLLDLTETADSQQRYLADNQPQNERPKTQNPKAEKSQENTFSPKSTTPEHKKLSDEQMLDVAETCFVRCADFLLEKGLQVRSVFGKFAIPEMMPDKTVLELLSPVALVDGFREAGIPGIKELESHCLLSVLAKPELQNSIILNELVLIMENFGVIDQDGDESDDFIPDTSSEKDETENQTARKKGKKYDLTRINEKGLNILKKLARYLLKKYLHPREFFAKSIRKEIVKTPKGKENLVDTLLFKDFYLKMKIASIRKRLTPNESIEKELCVDPISCPDKIYIKNFIKALEQIAEAEQKLLAEEEESERQRQLAKEEVVCSEPDTPKSNSEEDKKPD